MSPVKASSMTLRDRAWLTISGRSQPEMCRSVAYLRSARAKEPPIRPVPRMVTREIKCGDIVLFGLACSFGVGKEDNLERTIRELKTRGRTNRCGIAKHCKHPRKVVSLLVEYASLHAVSTGISKQSLTAES